VRIIIAGTRTYAGRKFVEEVLDKLTVKLDEVVVITGDAKGPDKFAYDWALANGFTVKKHHADWTKHGKKAGMIRNSEMVEDAGPKGALIAFHDGESPGTADTIQKARKAGLKVKVVKV
jgi:hypothetical protein